MKKFLCFRILLFSCVVLCLMLVPVVTFAVPMIYSYTGNPFNIIDDEDPPEGSYTTSQRVVASFTTTDGLLHDDTNFYSISPYLSSWIASDGRNVISSLDGNLYALVKVNGGDITAWGMWFTRIEPEFSLVPGTQYLTVSTTSGYSGDPSDIGRITETVIPGTQQNFDTARVQRIPGSWTSSPVPEPTSILLLGSGLVGLAVIGRKRFKK